MKDGKLTMTVKSFYNKDRTFSNISHITAEKEGEP